MSKASSFRVREAESRLTVFNFTALRTEKVPPASYDIAGDLWRVSNQNQRLLCRKGSACRGGELAMCLWTSVRYLLAVLIQNRPW